MFAKPYKLKSNTTLKNSEKKHLVQRIRDEFPSSTEEKVKELVPAKSTCICMKLVLYSGDTVNVYSVDSVPMVIETEERLLPTVCALWKVPDLVPQLIIHSLVLSKIQGGAPLYLPGVVTPAGGVGFPMFQRNTVIALCTHDNAAAGTVGRALMSSADMLLRAGGVCLETLHVFGDQLCKDNKFIKIERPRIGVASYGHGDVVDLTEEVNQLSMNPTIKEEWPSLGKQPPPVFTPTHVAASASPETTPAAPVPNEPRLILEQQSANIQEHTEESEECMLSEDSPQTEDLEIPTDPDGLLRWCLLSFLKLHAKNQELPFKTNLLYKSLMQLCPSDRSLDVKKSTYKKLGKFLEVMQQEGLLEVREVEKGVSAVTGVNLAHPAVRTHRVPASLVVGVAQESNPGRDEEYVPPVVREVYCVTAAVAGVFTSVKKGTPLTAGEIRTCLTDYVKVRNLHSADVKGAVTMDATLAKITGKPEGESLKWDVLMSSAQGRMTPSTEMRFADDTVKLTKTKLEPIKMQVASRSGNKKVTLVSNLEAFGFSLPALSHVCQTGVAASCSVTRSAGSKYDQLMVQGDQTHFVAKLLIERYGLPKKYVEGADKALNKKK